MFNGVGMNILLLECSVHECRRGSFSCFYSRTRPQQSFHPLLFLRWFL